MRVLDPEKHAVKRLAILDAATRCFARNGFEQTRTADIARAAGISSGALFHYFPTKMAIFSAIFEYDGQRIAARLALAESSDDPLGALLEFVGEQLTEADDPDFAGLALEISAQANRDGDFAAIVLANDQALRAGMARLLTRAAAEGRIELILSAEATASWLVALVDGAFLNIGSDPAFRPTDGLRVVERFLKVS